MYTHTTWGQAKDQLAARLHDSGKVYFVDAELALYLTESLRTFQVLTGYWRERGVFSTTNTQAFYSLPTVLPALRGYNTTGGDLTTLIEYHLLEPPTPTYWSGTEQFTLLDVTSAIQRRRDQFLVETGCHLTYHTQISPPPPVSRVPLPDTTIDIRWVSWMSPDSLHTHLWREDEWAFTTFDTTWNTEPTTPQAYSIATTPPVSLQLFPIPIDIGTLKILSIQSGAAVSTYTLLGIPDDFSWIVKWGVLSDLLSKDGPARDEPRAEYCNQRYQQGIMLANLFTTIYAAEVDGVAKRVDPLADLDAAIPDWLDATSTPSMVISAGPSMTAIYPVPDASAHSITLDVARNTPIPSSNVAYLQVSREELEAILGYAEHLAMFKVSGAEFKATSHYWDNMIQIAINYRNRLSAAVRYHQALISQTHREEQRRPRKQGEQDAEATRVGGAG